MGKRKGKCVKKNKVSKQSLEPEHLVKAPHSFVIHRGQCGKDIIDLTRDFRKIMEPFTASQLKERKKNSIKDFLSVSGYLHVSHMMVFTETEQGSYMKLARLPRGPTLTFQIHNYSLARDVVSSLRKQYVMMKAFQNAPLIVLNSFSGEGMHMKLMATMFQNMFPTINVTNVKLKNIRRCVLMNYNPSSKLIDLRHYVIRAIPVGLNKGTKKVVQGKVPNLRNCKDIGEFFEKAGLLSESEFEDDPASYVTLPQNLASRAALAQYQSAIRLSELGPRITLQLIKVEDGLMDGEVLFHELISKTEEEKELIRKKREEKKRLKESRKAKQLEDIKRKEREKEELKKKSLEGIKKKKQMTESERLMELAVNESQSQQDHMDDDEDDDAEYYRREVGAEPDKDLFQDITPSRKYNASNRKSSNISQSSKLCDTGTESRSSTDSGTHNSLSSQLRAKMRRKRWSDIFKDINSRRQYKATNPKLSNISQSRESLDTGTSSSSSKENVTHYSPSSQLGAKMRRKRSSDIFKDINSRQQYKATNPKSSNISQSRESLDTGTSCSSSKDSGTHYSLSSQLRAKMRRKRWSDLFKNKYSKLKYNASKRKASKSQSSESFDAETDCSSKDSVKDSVKHSDKNSVTHSGKHNSLRSLFNAQMGDNGWNDLFTENSNSRKRKSESSFRSSKKMRTSESHDNTKKGNEAGSKRYSDSSRSQSRDSRSRFQRGKNNSNVDHKKKFQVKAGNRRFQDKDGNRKFQHKDGKFQNKDGKFQNKDGKFQNKDRKFQNKDGGKRKNSDKGFKHKKVFGGKFNKKMKGAPKSRGKGSKSKKGKGRNK